MPGIANTDADSLALLGAKINFVGDAVLLAAAEKEVLANRSADQREKKMLSAQASNLSSLGNLLSLTGDAISAISTNAQTVSEGGTSAAAKAAILGGWLNVVGNAFIVKSELLQNIKGSSESLVKNFNVEY